MTTKHQINLGQGSFLLKKSNSLIGVKLAPGAKKIPAELTERRLVARWIGGFRIYKVARSLKKLNAILDKIRKHRNIQLGTHVYFAAGSEKPLVPTGKLFVIFEEKTKKKDQLALLKKHNLELIRQLKSNELIASVSKKSKNPIKAAEALQAAKQVIHAEPDVDSPLEQFDLASPPDDLFIHQWQLRNEGANGRDPRSKIIPGADLKVTDAWIRLGNRGSANITVAIVDRGLDLFHPDYIDKIVKPFSLFTADRKPTQGIDAGSTHGTSCAGLAIASSNGAGIVGVAPNAKFMPIEGASLSWESLEVVMRHCMDNGADVISCSWGSTNVVDRLTPRHMEVLTEVATQGRNGKGCVVLFAVGNENLEFLSHYATHPNVIAVAGNNSADEHFSVSNRGMEITVCAPAGDWAITAPRASWDDGHSFLDGHFKFWVDGIPREMAGLYKHFEGTSASCPLVAGVCALVLSANPNLRASEVKEILKITADKIGSQNEYTDGYSLRFGYGRVNADRAVAEALRRLNPTGGVTNEDLTSGNGLFRFDVEPQKAKGFGVQVGVFKEYGNVLIQTSNMKKTFGEPIIVNINELNGATVYKVILGVFSTSRKAKPLLAKVKAKGIDSFITNLSKLK